MHKATWDLKWYLLQSRKLDSLTAPEKSKYVDQKEGAEHLQSILKNNQVNE